MLAIRLMQKKLTSWSNGSYRVGLMLCLGCLLFGCAPQVAVPENAQHLKPEVLAQAFATALLEKADYEESMKWCDPAAAEMLNSQSIFLNAPKRQVTYVINALQAPNNGSITVTVAIKQLKLEKQTYTGELHITLNSKNHRITQSELNLKRQDGLRLTM